MAAAYARNGSGPVDGFRLSTEFELASWKLWGVEGEVLGVGGRNAEAGETPW